MTVKNVPFPVSDSGSKSDSLIVYLHFWTTVYNFGAILKNDEFINNSVPFLKYSVPFVKDSVPFIKNSVPFIKDSVPFINNSVPKILYRTRCQIVNKIKIKRKYILLVRSGLPFRNFNRPPI